MKRFAMKARPGSDYTVRIAANGHWSAERRTIRVWANSADNARAEALRHELVQNWPERTVIYTRRHPTPGYR